MGNRLEIIGWDLSHYGKTRRALAGVPWRLLTPEEYAAAVELHPGMETQGYFIPVYREALVSSRYKVTQEPPATPPAEELTDD